MSEKALRPDIRFGQFDGDWKERKLRDFAAKQIEKNSDGKIEETFTNSAEFGVISQLDYFDHDITNESNITSYTIIGDDDFVYNPRISTTAPVGPINRNGLGREGVMSPLYTIFRADDTTHHPYLEYYFKTNLWHPFMYHEGNTGARFDRFSIGDKAFFDMPVMCPSIQEQELVAKTLKSLDRLILLEQKKLDDLKNTKSAMLVKMFPKEGETVPEVRFEGFSGEWEWKLLGDVFEEYSDKGHAELPPLTIIQGKGTIPRDESDRAMQYDKANLNNYKKVNKDDFIVHLRSFEGGLEKANSQGIISPAYHTFHGENTDVRFYYAVFRSRKFIDVDLIPHVYGIRDGRSIDIEGMKTIKIPCPSIKEQSCIGDHLERLDRLITLHQRKLDKLKDTKKAMLNKMFV